MKLKTNIQMAAVLAVACSAWFGGCARKPDDAARRPKRERQPITQTQNPSVYRDGYYIHEYWVSEDGTNWRGPGIVTWGK
jgi:hypothetical protein